MLKRLTTLIQVQGKTADGNEPHFPVRSYKEWGTGQLVEVDGIPTQISQNTYEIHNDSRFTPVVKGALVNENGVFEQVRSIVPKYNNTRTRVIRWVITTEGVGVTQ